MNSSLLAGTLDMLVLEVLLRGESYGYQISQTVFAQSDGLFELKEGSLYPALHRLERGKLLSSFWVHTDEGRRRKYYRITAKGKRILKTKRDEWTTFAAGVRGVLGARHALA